MRASSSERRARRPRDAIGADLEREFAELAVHETIGVAPKQLLGLDVERLTCAMLRQRVAERERPAERRVERDHVVLRTCDPTRDRVRGRFTRGAERHALELELAVVADDAVGKAGALFLGRAVDSDDGEHAGQPLSRAYERVRAVQPTGAFAPCTDRLAGLRHALRCAAKYVRAAWRWLLRPPSSSANRAW